MIAARGPQRVCDVLQAIKDLNDLVDPISFQEFESDRVKRAAFERFVEILSEASRSLPDELKAENPNLPWQRIADIGNHLRHAYHRTDPEILWNLLAHRHLEELENACRRYLATIDDQQ